MKAFQYHKTQFLLSFCIKKKCGHIFPSTVMPPNFIHLHQKVDIKSVLESCDHLKTALFIRFYSHSSIFIFTHCNAITYM